MECRYLNKEQLCSYLGISKETMYKWIYKKYIPVIKMGKLYRFDKNVIDKWMKEKVVK